MKNLPRMPDLVTLQAVGAVLGRELAVRDARIEALTLGAAIPAERGAPGERGPEGPAGRDGVDGKDGAAGRDGLDGKDGANGKDGAPGRDGLDGAAGKDGKDGTPGEKGAQGDSGLDGVDGAQGKDGANGRDGAPGIGLDAPTWAQGVYRAGVQVQHHLGQHFRARCDTASEPPSGDWERLGTFGFRLTGGWREDALYVDGDLFIRDFSLFLWQGERAHLLAARGAKGEPGQRGLPGFDGKPGRDGRDGATLEAAQVREATLVLVQRTGAGDLSEIVVDFMPFLESTLYAVQERLQQAVQGLLQQHETLAQTVAELAQGKRLHVVRPPNP